MPKNPKILMLVENMSVPADPRVWKEAQALRQSGFQVCIICPKGEQRDQEAYVCINGIHIYRYTLNITIHRAKDYVKEYALAMLKTLGLSIKVWFKHGFDVIHAANPPDIFFAIGLFYRLFGKKYLFDQHDLAPEVFHIRFQNRMQPLYRLLKLFERCSYQLATVVITTNETQKQTAVRRGHCQESKVFVVRNGPDIHKFSSPPAVETDLKQGKSYLLAYIGVMGVQDGVDYALRALYELVHRQNRKDIMLVLMGNGDQLSQLKSLAHDLEINEYVNFTGWVEHTTMLQYLSSADIGLSPDPSNELNDTCTMLKTMEYMAMSKPIVAFNLPETRYTAQEAALYATPNSIADFAHKIEVLLQDAELRQQMGQYGRIRIEQTLSWNHAKMNLWQAYQTLFPTHTQQEQFQNVEEAEKQTSNPETLSPIGD